MRLGPVVIGRPSDDTLAGRLAQAETAHLTYDHAGATLSDGPGVRTEHLVVGHGDQAFDHARHALQTWAPQRAIGACVFPAGAGVEEGRTILIVLGAGPFTVVVPNRVVAVIDEPGRFAYAYGTLPGHHERGEESFTVDLAADGTVTATVRVKDRPGTLLAQLARPAIRVFQAAAIRRYLEALVRP